VAIRLVRAHPAMRDLHRLRLLLAGPHPDAGAQVRLAMLSGGLVMAGVDPALAACAPDDLRRHLLDTARRTLGGR
jgi:hypothetical protein